MINWQIQAREIAIKERQALREIEMEEMRQLGTFINHALADSVYIRYRFAQYFASVTRAPELKTGWRDYLKLVEVEYETTERERKEAERKKEELQGKIAHA